MQIYLSAVFDLLIFFAMSHHISHIVYILTVCRDNAWLYISATFAVVWIAAWLYRDSLEIEDVSNKYVFVSGCDSGFGNLLCKKLERKGFHVLAGCLTEKGAEELKKMTGPYLKTVLLDVTSQDSIQKAMEWTKKEVGDSGERFVSMNS